MGKGKTKEKNIPDLKAAEVLAGKIKSCAKSIESGNAVSNEAIGELLIKGADQADVLERSFSTSQKERIMQKLKGYRVTLAITQEYKDKRAISLACTGKQIEYDLQVWQADSGI